MFSFNPSTGNLDVCDDTRRSNEVYSSYSSNSSTHLEDVWSLILPLSGGDLSGNLKTPSPLVIKDNNSNIEITDSVSVQTNSVTPNLLLRIIVNGENKVVKLFDDNN